MGKIDVSVVVSTYRRVLTLERILRAWLEMTDDVWLADCSLGAFSTSLPIHHVRFSRDEGNRTRHAVATLTRGDFVIKADDDVVPKLGLIDDFTRYADARKILGLIGRRFHGATYYHDTEFFRANKITSPVRVDFVGVVSFVPRQYLAFDLRGCGTPIEDLFAQVEKTFDAEKWVIPTDKFENFKDDEICLFHNASARVTREKYYSRLFAERFRGQDPWMQRNI